MSKGRGRTPKKPKKNPGGRPEIPPHLRKVTLAVRVPARVRDGFKARALAHGTDSRGVANSSVGLEVERAFDASQNASHGVSDGELNDQLRRWSHAGLV